MLSGRLGVANFLIPAALPVATPRIALKIRAKMALLAVSTGLNAFFERGHFDPFIGEGAPQ